jgi:hypothetical protein
MPLLDHFTEPVDPRRKWATFHAYWAANIGRGLNRTLPERFFAAVNVHQGSQVAADVAEYDYGPAPVSNGSGGGLATQTYVVPAVTGTAPGLFPDEIELPIVDTTDDRLVAVIELISPANKDRPAARRAFAAKCAAYLHRGVGVLVVDVVVNRHFNLHDELAELMRWPDDLRMAGAPEIYVVSYRPAMRDDRPLFDFWTIALELGNDLPTLPLALKGWGSIPLDLEESYSETCRDTRQSS